MQMSSAMREATVDSQPSGRSIIAAIKSAGIDYVLSVPDLVTSDGLLFPIADDPSLRLIRVCKEDEGIGIAAGLSFGSKRALILIQHTGLLDSVNALRAVAVEQRQPICMMVGLLNKEPGIPPRESQRYGVRIIEPLLDVLGIRYLSIETAADVAKIAPAIVRCYEQSEPVAILIGRSPA